MSADFDEDYYISANPDVVLALKQGLVRNGWEHFIRFGKAEGRPGLPPAGVASAKVLREHRRAAREILTGRGVEVGALDRPLEVSAGTAVTYCDRFTPEQARQILPGLGQRDLARVDQVIDLNTSGLGAFADESQDFVVACNVLQHVADPLRVMGEAFRATKPGGHVVLAVPDKRYTFEASRSVTSFEHLLEEYLQGTKDVSDAHYVDLLVLFCPSDVAHGVSAIASRLADFRRRLEHAHVWDGASFREFLTRGFRVLDVEAKIVFEARGEETASEHFVVFQKIRQMLE